MKSSLLIFALLLATAVPAESYAKNCSCPCAHPKRRAVVHAAHAAPKPPKEPQVKRIASHPIAGGKTAAKAAPIEFEHVYKINHALKKGAKDYFSVPLEPGTELTLAMKSLKKADVSLDLIDPKDQTVATLALDGAVNEAKRVSWKPLKTGRHLIAIGSSQGDVGANQVIFEATIALAPLECAANDGEPTPIVPENPHQDCFWQDDTKDVLHFEGDKKDDYRIEIDSTETTAGLQATVGLEQKKKAPKILADVSGSGGRVAVESVVLPAKGTYSLTITLTTPPSDVIPYTVTFTKISSHK